MRRSLMMAGFAVTVVAGLMPAAPAAISHGLPFSPVIGLSRPASTSFNWAGYATFKDGTRFTDVKGSWTQPIATCTDQEAYASFWIGIDGYNSNTVEQIGTDADCIGGSPKYWAWYEMYPKFPVSLGLKISSGDLLTAEVASSSGHAYRLSITDTTSGESFTTTQTSESAMRTSAEWVVEISYNGHDPLPLTNFGRVQFSGSYTTGSGHTGSIGDAAWSNDGITMASATVPKAVVSALSPDGTAFSVTWMHS